MRWMRQPFFQTYIIVWLGGGQVGDEKGATSGFLGEWMMLQSAEKILDGQCQGATASA